MFSNVGIVAKNVKRTQKLFQTKLPGVRVFPLSFVTAEHKNKCDVLYIRDELSDSQKTITEEEELAWLEQAFGASEHVLPDRKICTDIIFKLYAFHLQDLMVPGTVTFSTDASTWKQFWNKLLGCSKFPIRLKSSLSNSGRNHVLVFD